MQQILYYHLATFQASPGLCDLAWKDEELIPNYLRQTSLGYQTKPLDYGVWLECERDELEDEGPGGLIEEGSDGLIEGVDGLGEEGSDGLIEGGDGLGEEGSDGLIEEGSDGLIEGVMV